MNQNWKPWIGVAAFAIVTLAIGYYLVAPSQAGGQAAKPLTSVVEGTEINLSFKQPGTIEQLLVTEGDQVKAGQLVAAISSEELLAKREQAVAAYELAKTKLAQAQAGVTLTDGATKAQIKQAEAAVIAAKANYEANKNGARPEELAQLTAKLEATRIAKETAYAQLQRMQVLYEEGAIAQAQLEEMTAKYEQAAAEYTAVEQQRQIAEKGARPEQLEATKAQLEQAQAKYAEAVAAHGQVEVKEIDVEAAEAAVQQAKGALSEIEAYIENTRLTVPVDGVVKSVAVKSGELVAQGHTVMTILADGERFAKFYVEETKLAGLQAGDKATIYLPALGKSVEGTVQMIAPAADFAVKKASQDFADRDMRAFQVKISIASPDVLPGFTAEWHIEGADQR